MKGNEGKDIFRALMGLLVMCAESAEENLSGAVRWARWYGEAEHEETWSCG